MYKIRLPSIIYLHLTVLLWNLYEELGCWDLLGKKKNQDEFPRTYRLN